MPIDITNKEEKQIALTGTQIEETLLQAHLSKAAIEKIEGLKASASEINNMVAKGVTSNTVQKIESITQDEYNLLSANKVKNGTFNNQDSWVKGTNYTISNGVLNANNTTVSSDTSQSSVFVVGETYIIKGDAIVVSGKFRIGSGYGTTDFITNSGSFEKTFTATNTFITIQGNAFIGSVDNLVVLKQGTSLIDENTIYWING